MSGDPVACLPEKEKKLLYRMVNAKVKTLEELIKTEHENVDAHGAGMSLHPQEIQEQLDAAQSLRRRLETAKCEEL